ncbi:MAG: tetratricopeptide repeat protein, partial [Thermoanaerobaculia bacterium]|nr:tetratricopeptide repeat protein [Thermoanaerobaculia bacterium]
ATAASAGEVVARGQELVDAGRLDEAAALLAGHLRRSPRDADAHLLLSTVRFLDGDTERGRESLERALELDPTLRQGWLNRAALDLSERRLEPALEALYRARDLDPSATDNALNIGAVLVLQGRLAEASEQFRDYLAETGDTAEAYLLVASNFAMAGYSALAIQHLGRAIEIDERIRRRARTDPNFRALAGELEFQQLLDHDGYLPPPGSLTARQTFDAAYDGGRGRLLQAVLNVLQVSGRSFDPQVEVTAGWSLLWSDFRIKVLPESPGTGAVELTAPPGRFTPAEWERQTGVFFREVAVELARMKRPF